MNLPERGFFNGAQRRAQLLRKGIDMYMGDTAPAADASASTGVWGDLVSMVKTALPIYQQQQVFQQQLNVAKAQGTPVAVNAQGQVLAAPPTNWMRIALLGGAGVLGVILLKSVMSRR